MRPHEAAALIAAIVLAATPARAQGTVPSPEWTQCVIDALMPAETQHGSVATWGVAAANKCKALYHGEDGWDVRMAVRLLERIREMATSSEPVPEPRPPADKRF